MEEFIIVEINDFKNYLETLDLDWWEKEDLLDLAENSEFDILHMNNDELDHAATELYWRAQGLLDEVNRLESQAGTIRRYIEILEDKE